MHVDIRNVFAEKRLRCTAQRVSVYSALMSTKTHPTAEQLHRMVQDDAPGTSLATVYNTLDALCDSGLARRIPTPTGVARYDADVSAHLHAVTEDGQVMDLPRDIEREILETLPRGLQRRLESRLGVGVRHVSVQFGTEDER